MRRIIVFAVIALMLVPVVVSANGAPDAKGGKIVIGANIYSFADNFMNGVMKPELERYAAEKGAAIIIVDSEGQQAKLNDQVDVFIAKEVDVLAINLVDPASAASVIEKASAAGIPLILFNKEATEAGIMGTYDKVWYVGTNSAESGIIQGEMMVADWKEHPEWDKNKDGVVQYVLLKGEPGHPDAEARTVESVKAFRDAEIPVEQLALEADPNWSTQHGNDKMQAWLTASFGDRIELVICNNDGMAFGAINALKAAGVWLPLYGVDALDQALTHIEDGEMNGTVLNDGVGQSRATVDLAVNAALGKDVTDGTNWIIEDNVSKAVRVPYVAVTPENYQDFR
ncbi:Galactose/methyl galactoside ABC transport system, D-galactose-binding periplasmic protein MglB (TC 3.A.1.2.3) [Olavius algarvensis spirochete endosymbiont]|uniref:galactose ABC transporter substrate-binding protein n=1 Tax=Olavius algarvensis spirochete endosymbiont TaxID=260710 RepID=UPI00052BB173|nr:galactose ABC transporter substrate-binding protein [Olavius algarvensis spirochete endosymbiont]KGM42925.1 sugar ABC transporter substrate-binding protein [Alkalispirochaeta odontotermitis]VDA99238.1 Galactose/methyl galactoside ABC transport system, D-galactose-binding periplasmic protein MglB (TC 3.A.1.2.3) [Olavius algarvensis spirochete endosymbiont]